MRHLLTRLAISPLAWLSSNRAVVASHSLQAPGTPLAMILGWVASGGSRLLATVRRSQDAPRVAPGRMTNPRKQGHVSSSADSRLRPGRTHIYTPTPEWVLLSGITPQAYMLYAALLAHVNRQRQDGVAWPGMTRLARILGFSRRQSVTRYLVELEQIGAVEVERNPRSTRRGHIYTIHEVAPDDYEGHRSVSDLPKEDEDAGQAPEDAGASVGAHAEECTGADALAHTNKTKPNQTKTTKRFTPPGVDNSALSSPETSFGAKLVLIKPTDFHRMTRPQAVKKLNGTFTEAVRHVGLEPSRNAQTSIGQWINRLAAEGITHDALWDQFVKVTERAVSGEKCRWLIDDQSPF